MKNIENEIVKSIGGEPLKMGIKKVVNKQGEVQSMSISTEEVVTELHFSKGKMDGIFVTSSEKGKGTASVLLMNGYSLVSAHGKAEFDGCLHGKGKLENKFGKEYVPNIDTKYQEPSIVLENEIVPLTMRFDKTGALMDLAMLDQGQAVAYIDVLGKIQSPGYQDVLRIDEVIKKESMNDRLKAGSQVGIIKEGKSR